MLNMILKNNLTFLKMRFSSRKSFSMCSPSLLIKMHNSFSNSGMISDLNEIKQGNKYFAERKFKTAQDYFARAFDILTSHNTNNK